MNQWNRSLDVISCAIYMYILLEASGFRSIYSCTVTCLVDQLTSTLSCYEKKAIIKIQTIKSTKFDAPNILLYLFDTPAFLKWHFKTFNKAKKNNIADLKISYKKYTKQLRIKKKKIRSTTNLSCVFNL